MNETEKRRRYDPIVDDHGNRLTRVEERLESFRTTMKNIEEDVTSIKGALLRISESLSTVKGVSIAFTAVLTVLVPIVVYAVSHIVFH